MVIVQLEIFDFFYQSFQELIGREEIIESIQRDGVLYTWIMCIECDQVGNTNQMWVGVSDGSGAKNSGSIVVLEMSTDGSLKEVARYKNVCGKVVDFEYKK